MHVIEHGFGVFCPDLIISAVTEQTDRGGDVAFNGESLLCFEILLLELCVAEEVVTLYLPTMGGNTYLSPCCL